MLSIQLLATLRIVCLQVFVPDAPRLTCTRYVCKALPPDTRALALPPPLPPPCWVRRLSCTTSKLSEFLVFEGKRKAIPTCSQVCGRPF